jgi:hypothetical protein
MNERKKAIIESHDFVNVQSMFDATKKVRLEDKLSMPLPAVLAKFDKESKGKNIYGHDIGGIFSTRDNAVELQGKVWPKGSNIPVTPSNAGIFLIKMATGAKSNGMGPSQITFASDLVDGRTGGYFRMMLEEFLLLRGTTKAQGVGSRLRLFTTKAIFAVGLPTTHETLLD